MVETGRFELLTPRTPSGLPTIDANCYFWLNLTTVISLRVPSGPAQLLLIYAIFYLGSPQKSPQSGGKE
jgi:hypothetical protein